MAACRELAESAKEPAKFGTYIPLRAFAQRDLTATGADDAGGYLVNDNEARNDLFTDVLRPYPRGATRRADHRRAVGRISAYRDSPPGATAYWTQEGVAPTESTQTCGLATLRPHRLTANVDYTRNLLLQAALLESILKRDLGGSIGARADAGMLNGSGTDNQPLGCCAPEGWGAWSARTSTCAAAAEMVAQKGSLKPGNVKARRAGRRMGNASRPSRNSCGSGRRRE